MENPSICSLLSSLSPHITPILPYFIYPSSPYYCVEYHLSTTFSRSVVLLSLYDRVLTPKIFNSATPCVPFLCLSLSLFIFLLLPPLFLSLSLSLTPCLFISRSLALFVFLLLFIDSRHITSTTKESTTYQTALFLQLSTTPLYIREE